MNFSQKTKRSSIVAKLLVDAVLLVAILLVFIYFKIGQISVSSLYVSIFLLEFTSWFLSSFIAKAYTFPRETPLPEWIRNLLTAILVMAGFFSIFLYGLKLFDLSRFIIWGTLLAFAYVQIVAVTIYYVFTRIIKGGYYRVDVSSLFFIGELILFTVFLGFYYVSRIQSPLNLTHSKLPALVFGYFVFLFVTLNSHRYSIKSNQKIYHIIWPYLKSTFIILSIYSFLIIAFKIETSYETILLKEILLLSLFEWSVVLIYAIYVKQPANDEVHANFLRSEVLDEPIPIEKIIERSEERKEKYNPSRYEDPFHIFVDRLQNVYLHNFPRVYKFLRRNLILSIDARRAVIINSANPYNIQILPDKGLDFILNLRNLNDFRFLNKYLIEINKKLSDGGVFVGCVSPLEKRYNHFRKLYPRNLANFLYLIDFIWKRAFPKLPFFQKFYFAVTKGKKRVISKAEALGRLIYTGFEIVALKEIDDKTFFIVKKVRKPSTDTNPSYSPIFKMKRVGKHGKIIYVYKFRTMYPYSEYLQPFVTQLYGYGDNGKIKNDFRVTKWGRFLRKYWLDELPQLLNVIKGEMRLVGIRPLSNRFLKEYPQDMLQLRLKHKPGCLPPYVALRKQAVEEYIESERIYLTEKEKHPVFTDIKYFVWGTYNILSNKIRSA